jgi:hypothetical protein
MLSALSVAWPGARRRTTPNRDHTASRYRVGFAFRLDDCPELTGIPGTGNGALRG